MFYFNGLGHLSEQFVEEHGLWEGSGVHGNFLGRDCCGLQLNSKGIYHIHILIHLSFSREIASYRNYNYCFHFHRVNIMAAFWAIFWEAHMNLKLRRENTPQVAILSWCGTVCGGSNPRSHKAGDLSKALQMEE